MTSLSIAYNIVGVDKITNKLRKIGRSIDATSKKMMKLGKASRKAGSDMEKSGKKKMKIFSKLAKSVKAYAVVAAAAFGAKAIISKGMEFEEAVASIEAITGATGKALDFYADSAINLSKKYGIAAAEVATSIKDIASGKSDLLADPKALVRITDQALTLAKAAGMTAPESVKSLVNSLNQWSLGAEHAARFTNVLAAGAKVGASEINDIAEALKNAGGIAAANNMTFEETNAALQAMSKSGLKGAIAGTGLAGVLRKMGQLGINVKEMGFEQALEMIKKVSEQKNLDLAAPELFGEHGKSILALIQNLEHMKVFKKEITGTQEAARQAAARSNTLRTRLQKLGARMDHALLSIFAALEPVITHIVVGLSDAIDNMDPRTIDAFNKSMKLFASTIGLIVKLFAELLKILHEVGTFLGTTAGKVVTYFTMDEDFAARDDYQSARAARPGRGRRRNPNALSEASDNITGGDSALAIDLNIKGNTEALAEKPVVKRKRGGRKVRSKTNMSR